MTELEKYIKLNKEAFDDKELPLGHEERFMAKLDAAVGGPSTELRDRLKRLLSLSKHRSLRRSSGTLRRIIRLATGVAAALAVFIFLERKEQRPADWFAGVGDNPVEIYKSYNERVAELYEVIFRNNPDGSMDYPATSIAEEAVPMIDQLPEGLDPQERTAILKAYYGELLDNLKELSKIKQIN